ncbi:hypothetical protein B0H14DRAFT_150114 [Mycena olivaceomarginata]|nr:hypothetical protein B0H14DRAFT_150114 [Mycena olivaceomarginata]
MPNLGDLIDSCIHHLVGELDAQQAKASRLTSARPLCIGTSTVSIGFKSEETSVRCHRRGKSKPRCELSPVGLRERSRLLANFFETLIFSLRRNFFYTERQATEFVGPPRVDGTETPGIGQMVIDPHSAARFSRDLSCGSLFVANGFGIYFLKSRIKDSECRAHSSVHTTPASIGSRGT